MMSFFSRIGQFAVFPLSLKETMQIDQFEQNKAAHLRKIKLVKTSSVTYFFTLVRIHSANSHGEFGEFARRRGTATAPPTANVFGTLRASAAGRCTLFRALYAWHGEFAVRIRMACRRRGAAAPPTANAAPRRRGAAHRHPPPTANCAAQRERQGEFTARSWPQLLMWARCHTAAR